MCGATKLRNVIVFRETCVRERDSVCQIGRVVQMFGRNAMCLPLSRVHYSRAKLHSQRNNVCALCVIHCVLLADGEFRANFATKRSFSEEKSSPAIYHCSSEHNYGTKRTHCFHLQETGQTMPMNLKCFAYFRRRDDANRIYMWPMCAARTRMKLCTTHSADRPFGNCIRWFLSPALGSRVARRLTNAWCYYWFGRAPNRGTCTRENEREFRKSPYGDLLHYPFGHARRLRRDCVYTI